MRILFLSVPTGQGHHQTCKALEAYYAGMENVECKTLDVVDNVAPFLGEALSEGYILSTKVTPGMYGKFYGMAEKRDVDKTPSLSYLIKMILNKKLFRVLKEYDPDVIVATHVWAAIAISYLRRKHPIRAKMVAVITDFTVHPFWEDVDIDYYITANELLEYQAIKKGYPLEKVKPFGIPINPKFANKVPKEEARQRLGLKDKFTVLLMMGSMGYGSSTMRNIKRLDKMDEDIQIITVCGNNKKLKLRIDKMKKTKQIINYGFTNEVDLLMDAADCIITKPGGLSTSEALAKNLPIIMLDPIPGQEDRNAEFMLNNGAAMSISEFFTVDEAIYQLVHHPHRMERMKENMKYIAKPNAAKEMGDFLLEICKESK